MHFLQELLHTHIFIQHPAFNIQFRQCSMIKFQFFSISLSLTHSHSFVSLSEGKHPRGEYKFYVYSEMIATYTQRFSCTKCEIFEYWIYRVQFICYCHFLPLLLFSLISLTFYAFATKSYYIVHQFKLNFFFASLSLCTITFF